MRDIRIDLLPPELKLKKRVEWGRVLPILVAVLIGFIIGFSWIVMAINASTLKGEIRRIDGELARKQEVVKLVRAVEEDIAKIKSRIEVIERIRGSRILWADMLDELDSLLPSQVWLTSIVLSEAGKVEVNGMGLSLSEISKLLRGLEGSPHFSNVSLIYAKETSAEGMRCFEFRIAGEVKKGSSAEKGGEAGR
jgi:Tfp pilus assembly protein PilN